MDLKDIKSPNDIKELSINQLKKIAAQMRDAILNRTSKIGGHVGSNLGDVEAVIALHYMFNAPTDKLVFDVSHQDFPHKMLTGRSYGYLNDADFTKVGEYTDPKESPEYDLFYSGHTSPALSLCCGLAKARDLKGEKYNVVAFVGDGSLSGGEAFEGLDTGGAMQTNLICIINDNQMAIAENHGGLYAHLQELRETNGTAANNLFRSFGWEYVYVADGNDIEALINAMRQAKDVKHPLVIHINTQKGEGYVPAEKYREEFHWMTPFDIASGTPYNKNNGISYEKILRDFIIENAAKHSDMLVISSATPGAFGLGPEERKILGSNYIVAIAEQTGVSVMAGAAKGGVKVIYCVVASFLQRAYDQLLEDWAMNDSPATLVVLSSGIKGIPDITHLGFWDIPMITSIPDIVYLAPTTIEEYEAMLRWSFSQDTFKVAIRQPTYSVEHAAEGELDTDYSQLNKFKVVRDGTRVAIVAVGDYFVKGREVANCLEKEGIHATLINPRFVSGVDQKLLNSLESDHELVVTIEDGSVDGGFGNRIAAALGTSQMKVLNFGLPKKFADQYNPEELERSYGLSSEQIAATISDLI